jgi:hypothetical protein
MTNELDNRLRELETRLNSLNERFTRELRARGFDPAQVETAALPGELAKLYLERQLLLAELSELTNRKKPGDDRS